MGDGSAGRPSGQQLRRLRKVVAPKASRAEPSPILNSFAKATKKKPVLPDEAEDVVYDSGVVDPGPVAGAGHDL